MTRFKAGDKVRVLEDLNDNTEYGNNVMTEPMLKFRGKVVTISEVVLGNEYHIEESSGYYWSDEMFESEVVVEFKVGDEIIVTGLDWIDELLGHMSIGSKLTIDKITEFDNYVVSNDEEYGILDATQMEKVVSTPKFKSEQMVTIVEVDELDRIMLDLSEGDMVEVLIPENSMGGVTVGTMDNKYGFVYEHQLEVI